MGVPVELPAPSAGPAPAPRRRERRGSDRRRRAGGDRRWRRRYRAGRIAGAGDGRAGGRRSSLGAPGRSQPRRRAVRGLRFDERSAGWRRRGGGCVTRSRGVGAGISTASRSPRPGSRSRSRPRRARSTHATWPAPGRRPRGFTGIGGAGAVEGRSRCCAWCAPAGSSRSRTRFSWCRLDRLAPALRAGAGTSPRPRFLAPQTSSVLSAERSRGLLVARSGAGGGVGEHADE